MIKKIMLMVLFFQLLLAQGKNYQSVAGLIANINMIDNISNNVANADTVGFKETNLIISTHTKKPDSGYSKKQLNYEKNTNEAANFIRQTIHKLPKTTGSFRNNKNGSVQLTGNPLNFAFVAENKWFIIKKPNKKEYSFTRDGRFILLNGILRTLNGHLVMSPGLSKIEVATKNIKPEELGVVDIDINKLKNMGDNLFSFKEKEEIKAIAGNQDYVLKGALENSNVNSILQMTKLISAHRLIDTYKKSIQTTQDMDKASQDVMGLK
jgi:flagellar basal-body rod protein FlgF